MPRRRRTTLALAVGMAASLAAPPAYALDPSGRPVAVAAEIASQGVATRLAVTLSRPVEASAFVLERPDRVVVELPEVNCQLPPESGRRRQGLVSGLRCGLFALGRTRLIVDLAAPAIVAALAQVAAPDGIGTQLLLDLAPANREAFAKATYRGERAEPETTGSLPSPAGARRPVVAIDAGHGGADSGAIAVTGAFEKDVVLAFAQAVRDRLAASGQVQVAMIRDADVFVPLDERVRLAHAAGADLLVSIHGDWIGTPGVRGATIYTGAERATDLEAARLAERENAADAAGGAVPPEARAGLSDILGELTLRETRGLSRRLAGLLHDGLSPVTRLSLQPRREAGFRVLRAPDMTSVLVELGYLSNAGDADLLLSDDWRARTAGAMASAIERFLAPRLAGRAAISP